LKEKRAIIQGWGKVVREAAYDLSQEGVKIVGIIDRDGGLLNPDGFTFEEITNLFISKDGNKLSSDAMMPFSEINEQIWSVGAEIFLPCAASRLISQDQVEQMIANDLEIIGPGANVPFADKEIFFGPIADYTDERVSLLPDFISNCGMARVFGYLMQDNIEMSDAAIFRDTSNTIYNALEKTHQKSSSKTGIAKTAFEIALNQLV